MVYWRSTLVNILLVSLTFMKTTKPFGHGKERTQEITRNTFAGITRRKFLASSLLLFPSAEDFLGLWVKFSDEPSYYTSIKLPKTVTYENALDIHQQCYKHLWVSPICQGVVECAMYLAEGSFHRVDFPDYGRIALPIGFNCVKGLSLSLPGGKYTLHMNRYSLAITEEEKFLAIATVNRISGSLGSEQFPNRIKIYGKPLFDTAKQDYRPPFVYKMF